MHSCQRSASLGLAESWVAADDASIAYMYHVTSIKQIRPPLLALRWGRAWTSPTSRDVHGQGRAMPKP